jgi:hypothetical protein
MIEYSAYSILGLMYHLGEMAILKYLLSLYR